MAAQCARCGQPAQQRCSGCSTLFYCGRQCQKADWRRHKGSCQLTELRSELEVGRFVVTCRPVPAGCLIMKEQPLVAGPQLEAEPQCLGCGRLLLATAAACLGCRWPICEQRCAALPAHAASGECAVLARDSGDRPTPGTLGTPQYDCILPLRLLLLRATSARAWHKVVQLESHVERRRDTDIYRDNQRHVVDYLRQRCAVDASEQLLHQLCGALDVNAFSLRPPPGFGRRRGLFARTSMLNHACVSNTNLSLDGDEMQVRAAQSIAAGGQVTASYVSCYEPTPRRRNFLLYGKYFECRCARCADPTELGTYYGSHRCRRCHESPRAADRPPPPAMVVAKEPLNALSDWCCQKCGHTQTATEVRQMNQLIMTKRAVIADDDILALEQFVTEFGSLLHDNNYHILQVKQTLAQSYGNAAGYQLDQLSEGRLAAKEDFCRAVIAASETFEPGISRLRGLLLLQLHHALVTRAQRAHAGGRSPPQKLLDALQKAGRLVEQAIAMLSQEPPSTPEGGPMLRVAKETLEGCYQLSQCVQNSIRS